MNEEIEVEKEGSEIIIGFNPRFLIDILKNIDDDTITMHMKGGKQPCIIKDAEENYIYVILPININAEAY
jgi:DNA polymerase-3 subunit beta